VCRKLQYEGSEREVAICSQEMEGCTSIHRIMMENGGWARRRQEGGDVRMLCSCFTYRSNEDVAATNSECVSIEKEGSGRGCDAESWSVS